MVVSPLELALSDILLGPGGKAWKLDLCVLVDRMDGFVLAWAALRIEHRRQAQETLRAHLKEVQAPDGQLGDDGKGTELTVDDGGAVFSVDGLERHLEGA